MKHEPQNCGVYILIKDYDVIYVGTSMSVLYRIKNHNIKDYDAFVIIPSPNKYRMWLESYLIYVLDPPLNKMRKGFYTAPIGKRHLKKITT